MSISRDDYADMLITLLSAYVQTNGPIRVTKEMIERLTATEKTMLKVDKEDDTLVVTFHSASPAREPDGETHALIIERYEAALRLCRSEVQHTKNVDAIRQVVNDAVDHALREGSYHRLAPGGELGPRAKPLSASRPPPPPDDIGGIEG